MALGLSPTEIVKKGTYPLLNTHLNWNRIFLSEIADVLNGFAFDSTNFNDKSVGKPLIRIRDVGKGSIETFYDGPWTKQYLVQNGDLLIGMDGDFRCAKWHGGEALLNQRVCKIVPNADLYNPEFLFYVLQPYLDAINAETSSVTVKHLSSKTIQQIPLPNPPLPVQKAIVAKIEELFSQLEAGVQELQTALKRLKIYRKLILNNAVIGISTSKWRIANKSLQNSAQLFLAIQMERDKWWRQQFELAKSEGRAKPKDPRNNKKSNYTDDEELTPLPQNWNYYRLDNICYVVTDGTHFTPKYQRAGVTFLSVKNVRPFEIKDKETKYISQEEHKSINKRCNPEKGDILYTKIGATYGYAAQIKKEYDFSIFVSLALIKPVQQYVLSDYLELVMNSEFIFKQARKRVSGSGVPDLHLVEIRDFKVPLPPLEEQQQIVAETLAEISEADAIELAIQEGLSKADALRLSILKKAFTGELITEPTDLFAIAESVAEYKATSRKIDGRSEQLSLF